MTSSGGTIQEPLARAAALPAGNGAPSPPPKKCPALAGGTGLLADGDFSQAAYPVGEFATFSNGEIFAPSWTVTGTSIDLYGSGFQTPGSLCSVDLDGTTGPGGIVSAPIPTTPHQKYTVDFLFSGNGFCAEMPPIKTMTVSAADRLEKFSWSVAKGKSAQLGDFKHEKFTFKATLAGTQLTFLSDDAKQSGRGSYCGPVVAAITVN
jgi:hypothetical protein